MEQQNIRITPASMRNFFRRLNNAAVRRKFRFEQLEEIRGRVAELSGEPLEMFSTEGIMKVKKVDLELKRVEDEEKLLGIRQKNEENEVSEMKRKIDELANKIESVGHLASMTSQEQYRRLEEMQKAFLEMHPAKVAEQEEVRQFILEKVKPLEEKKAEAKKAEAEKAEVIEIKKPSIHPKIIKGIERQISDAEKMHKRLVKAGHPPERLEILKDKIDMHRRRLKAIRGK